MTLLFLPFHLPLSFLMHLSYHLSHYFRLKQTYR
jgi:hypothetical protein